MDSRKYFALAAALPLFVLGAAAYAQQLTHQFRVPIPGLLVDSSPGQGSGEGPHDEPGPGEEGEDSTPPVLNLSVEGTGAAGAVFVGEGMPMQLVLSNDGETAMPLSISVAGDHAADFEVSAGSSCQGMTLASGSSCVVHLMVSPSEAGLRAATLLVSSPDAEPFTVALSALGVEHVVLSAFQFTNEVDGHHARVTGANFQTGMTLTVGGVTGTVGAKVGLDRWNVDFDGFVPVGNWPITVTSEYESFEHPSVRAVSSAHVPQRACYTNLGGERFTYEGYGLVTPSLQVTANGSPLPILSTSTSSSKGYVSVEVPAFVGSSVTLRFQRNGAPSAEDYETTVPVTTVTPLTIQGLQSNTFDVAPTHLEWVASDTYTGWLYYSTTGSDLRRTYPGGPTQSMSGGQAVTRGVISNAAAPGRAGLYYIQGGDLKAADVTNIAVNQSANTGYTKLSHVFLNTAQTRVIGVGFDTSGIYISSIPINASTGWFEAGGWNRTYLGVSGNYAAGSVAYDRGTDTIFIVTPSSNPEYAFTIEVIANVSATSSLSLVRTNHLAHTCGAQLTETRGLVARNGVLYLATPTAIWSGVLPADSSQVSFHAVIGSPFESGVVDGNGRSARFQSIGAMTLMGTGPTVLVADGRHYRNFVIP